MATNPGAPVDTKTQNTAATAGNRGAFNSENSAPRTFENFLGDLQKTNPLPSMQIMSQGSLTNPSVAEGLKKHVSADAGDALVVNTAVKRGIAQTTHGVDQFYQPVQMAAVADGPAAAAPQNAAPAAQANTQGINQRAAKLGASMAPKFGGDA